MADSKVTQLTESTSPAATDLVYVVANPAGTPADRKVKLSNLLTAIGAQPLDSDLTAIAALTTTSYGRALLALADAAALRTAAGLGTAAVVNTGTSGANVPTITQADARYQALDSDLTAIAALSTTSYGRAFLALADAAAARTAIDAQQAGTSLQIASNLSDVANATTARNNLSAAPKSSAGSRRDITASTLTRALATWADIGAWTNGPGAAGYDVTIAAAAGDLIEYGVNAIWQGDAVAARMDVATIVSNAVVNTFSGASVSGSSTYGIAGWAGGSGTYDPITGSAWLTLQAGDVNAGTVTLRPFARPDSAVSKGIVRGPTNPVMFFAKNHGPALPF